MKIKFRAVLSWAKRVKSCARIISPLKTGRCLRAAAMLTHFPPGTTKDWEKLWRRHMKEPCMRCMMKQRHWGVWRTAGAIERARYWVNSVIRDFSRYLDKSSQMRLLTCCCLLTLLALFYYLAPVVTKKLRYPLSRQTTIYRIP